MALRLRRGTDAERQLITPEAGEPLWIDNQALWIGDGSTVGGIKVTGGIENDLATVSIDALSDVDTTSVAPTTGDALVWDGSNFTPGVPALTINDLSNVDVVSNPPSNGDSLIWNGASWEPGQPAFNGTLVGDLTGSVFADDSTVIVDGVNNTISATTVTAPDMFAGTITTNSFNSLYIKPANLAQINTLTVEAIDQQAKLNIRRASDSNIIGSSYDTDGSGGVVWTRDGLDGDQLIGGIFGYENALSIFSNDTTNNFPESHHIIWRDGKLGVGVFFPSESLETSGNAVINGSIQGSEILIEANNITTTSSNANLRLTAAGTGTVELDIPTQTTVGAAGGAAALPATPDIYFKINVAGTEYVVPGFAVS